ncbi:hypothetical protein D9M69_640880 [compost metagenome]
MAVNAGGFTGQIIFAHAVKMMHSRLRRPANIQRAMNMRLRPVENALHFIPIGDVLKWHTFNRRTRNDKTIKALITHLFPRTIEGEHVIG